MKFVSKLSNHRVTLIPSQPGEPITGRLATPALFVKFESGVANVNDEKAIELMLNHPRFNRDFLAPELVEGKAAGKDPYAYQRRSLEPEHTHTNVQYGHIGKATGAPKGVMTGLSRDKAQMLQKAIDEEATKKAMALAPELAKQLLKSPELIAALKKDMEVKEKTVTGVATSQEAVPIEEKEITANENEPKSGKSKARVSKKK